MSKSGIKKLCKLKSMLKRFPSFSSRVTSPTSDTPDADTSRSCDGLRPVYVGKSRRRYLIPSELVGHPLLQVLLQRSTDGRDGGEAVVGCEVVLFEHLLWMLENGEGENYESSLDELVEYYACC